MKTAFDSASDPQDFDAKRMVRETMREGLSPTREDEVYALKQRQQRD